MHIRLPIHALALIAGVLGANAVNPSAHAQANTLTPFSFPANVSDEGTELPEGNIRHARALLGAETVADVLNGLAPEEARNLRGAQEERLFQNVSPGVVFIQTRIGIGTGTLISGEGEILTNWHVVEGGGEILVGFLPDSGFDPRDAKVFTATLERYDQVTDLALLKLAEPVPENARVVPLGTPTAITIGSDVHAIGHPTGKAWTYTKGFVSQIRYDYQWVTELELLHHADVVQTQTPINIGNSGGPLLDNAGTLVGVNSFISEGEGLNFAVAVSAVTDFLGRTENRDAERVSNAPLAADECEGVLLDVVRSEDDDGDVHIGDLDCNGVPDIYEFTPDDPNEPFYVFLDFDENGFAEAQIQDDERDGRFDSSLWDEDEDGTAEVCGIHEDGELVPTSYVNC